MKSLRYSTLLLLFMMASVPRAFSDEAKTVTVINNSPCTMTEFYASPSVNSDWDTSNNLLAGNTIAPGQTTIITISDGIDHCHYDVMGVLHDATEHAYQYRLNACEGDSWTVSE